MNVVWEGMERVGNAWGTHNPCEISWRTQLGTMGTHVPWGPPWVTKGESRGLFVGEEGNILGTH